MEDNGGFPTPIASLMIEALFSQALGLLPPWQVDRVDFAPEKQRIDFHVRHGPQRSSELTHGVLTEWTR